MDFVKRAKGAYIAVSAVMISLGIVLVLWPDISAFTVCYIVGALLMLFGVIKLVGYFSKDLFRLAFQFDMALGIAALVAGAILIIHPVAVISAIHVVLGVMLLVDGAFKIQTASDAKRFGMARWWSILIFAIVTSIMGVFLIVNPFDGAKTLMVLIGVAFIVDGIQNLCIAAYTVKVIKAKKDEANVVYVE